MMCGSLREQRRDVQLLYSSVLREGRREWGQGRFTVTKEKRGAGVIIFCHFLVNYCYFTSWNNIINIVPSRRALFSHEYLLRQRHPASEKKKSDFLLNIIWDLGVSYYLKLEMSAKKKKKKIVTRSCAMPSVS